MFLSDCNSQKQIEILHRVREANPNIYLMYHLKHTSNSFINEIQGLKFTGIMTLLQNVYIKQFSEVYLLSIQDANLTLEEQ